VIEIASFLYLEHVLRVPDKLKFRKNTPSFDKRGCIKKDKVGRGVYGSKAGYSMLDYTVPHTYYDVHST
jgi:hypothetical protein